MRLKKDSSEQKLRGAYYTPLQLADAMVELFASQNNLYPKFVLNECNAVSTDTMHRIKFNDGVDPENVLLAYYNSISFAFTEICGRSYGGGVLEILPGEMGNILLPKVERIDPALRDKLLRLITQTSSLESLKRSLTELQDENLQHLTTSLNIEKLQRVAKLMEDNLKNDSEEFWQTTVFKENQWVLAQIFACPCTIFADKAYVGGKGINNSGGNLCDFIYQNSLSQNVALIEIKTPCTELIGNQYRGTYSFSYDLSGAVNQVLNYRDKLTKEYYSLCHQGSEPFEVLSPKCVVIIGKMASLTPGQVVAFENFRNSLGNVLILTFDELYQRIVDLISVLSESPAQEQNSIEQNDNADELPF